MNRKFIKLTAGCLSGMVIVSGSSIVSFGAATAGSSSALTAVVAEATEEAKAETTL